MIHEKDLTDGQKLAISMAKNVIEKASRVKGQFNVSINHLTIKGPAGTGKSTVMKFILDWIRNSGIKVCLSAPTHQSKKVLSDIVGEEVSTIHSVLKINPSTYEEKMYFEQRSSPNLETIDVLVCEEASLYDSKLFEILMNSIMPWTVIIAIGDQAQLRPGNDDNISRFFTDKRFKVVELTEIKRSNTPIITVGTEIRTGGNLGPCIIDGHGVHSNTSVKEFLTNYFSIVKQPSDLYETRVMAFTNKSVDTLNKIIRKELYKTVYPFIKDEVVVAQDPYIQSIEIDGKKFEEIVYNNGELLKINDVRPVIKKFRCKNYPNTIEIEYMSLQVESIDYPNGLHWINVLVDDENLYKTHSFLSKVADHYKSGQCRPAWKDFWKIKNHFNKIKPLPVSTIHKSQGTTVTNSFLYTPCTYKYADYELMNQLLYVGVTRARTDVYYI